MAWRGDRHDTEGQSAREPATSRGEQLPAPGSLLLTDTDGLRHAIKVRSIQMPSEGDIEGARTVAEPDRVRRESEHDWSEFFPGRGSKGINDGLA